MQCSLAYHSLTQANYISDLGIKTTIVSRADYTADSIKDADMVLAAGGDGTFLLAASQIRSSAIPLIGVNTDPEKYVWLYM